MTDHLGHEKNRVPEGRGSTNVRSGTRPKTVLTHAAGEVELTVPRDRDGGFAPVIVKKRQRRPGEVDEIVLSLYARGLTTGKISAHFAQIYGASVSKETISRITDKVTRGGRTSTFTSTMSPPPRRIRPHWARALVRRPMRSSPSRPPASCSPRGVPACESKRPAPREVGWSKLLIDQLCLDVPAHRVRVLAQSSRTDGRPGSRRRPGRMLRSRRGQSAGTVTPGGRRRAARPRGHDDDGRPGRRAAGVVPQMADQQYRAGRAADLGIGVAQDGPTPTTSPCPSRLRRPGRPTPAHERQAWPARSAPTARRWPRGCCSTRRLSSRAARRERAPWRGRRCPGSACRGTTGRCRRTRRTSRRVRRPPRRRASPPPC